ncbi:Der1-like family-domain-containing protein [Chlamydoabsidia padenii]|nr:Der1-like family-domain-containing protein [Chlamydoabsidia padenii]
MPPPPQTTVQNEFLRWYNGLPPVTKAIITTTVALSVSSAVGLVKAERLYLVWPFVYRKLQLWRMVTSFYLRSLNLSFAFDLYFMYTYSTKLELDVFQGRTSDYIYFLLLTSGVQLLLDGFFQNIVVLSSAVVPTVMYLWSKHYADQQVSFMFGLQFKAIFLPWVVAGYEYVASGGQVPYGTLYGIASAHLYYYLKTIHPGRGGRQYLATPGFLQRLFPASVGGHRAPGVGYVWPGQQQQQQQQRQERTNFMGGHNWGRGHRLT